MKKLLFPLVAALTLLACGCGGPGQAPKRKMMWLDCSAKIGRAHV